MKKIYCIIIETVSFLYVELTIHIFMILDFFVDKKL